MPGCRAPLPRTLAGSRSAPWGTRGCSPRRSPPRGGSRRAGSRRGDRVAIALPAGEDFAVALHGCLLLGAVAVPIDPRLPASAERAARAASCAVLVDGPLDGRRGPVAPSCADRHDLDAPAVVVHTSGTSAGARPVTLTYGNWLWSALGSAVALGVDPRRALALLPARSRTSAGSRSCCARRSTAPARSSTSASTPSAVLAALRDPAGPTLVSLVPATLTRLLDAGLREPPALRWALLGGAAIPPALLDARCGRRRARSPRRTG